MSPQAHTAPQLDSGLKLRIAAVGNRLKRSLESVLNAVPESPRGPAAIARTIGVDKVLTSRALKAARSREPLGVIYLAPGPEPLRKLLRAAKKGAVAPELIAEAEEAVGQFETLICQEAGDRSALDTMISGWLVEARSVFDLRRKQSAFRAMSQLLGAASDTTLCILILAPAADGESLDLVCVQGFYALQRLRVGSTVKFSTRRLVHADRPRKPSTLAGKPIDDVSGLRLDEFSSKPPAELNVFRVGEVLHYALAGDRLGPRAATDLVFAEVNRAELRHVLADQPQRRRFVSSDVTVPTKLLVFDALLHEDVYPGADPDLFVYDTTFDGGADVNDPARDIDRLDVYETIHYLGTGTSRFRAAEVPRYGELLQHVYSSLGWEGGRFRGYRCRVEYPIYGTQVMMAFRPRAGQ